MVLPLPARRPDTPTRSAPLAGRFADEFVAHRRAQLQTFLAKTAAHAVLQLDPLLRAFLTADNWAGEMKHWTVRRSKADAASAAGEKGYLAGLTSGLTGSKFVERDPWFDERKAVLDTLEGQLKALVKSVELVSKQRLGASSLSLRPSLPHATD